MLSCNNTFQPTYTVCFYYYATSKHVAIQSSFLKQSLILNNWEAKKFKELKCTNIFLKYTYLQSSIN